MKWIFADFTKFKQILYNLLSNAVKFTSEGGSITISGSIIGNEDHFSVEDTGKGIAPDALSYKLINSKQNWKKGQDLVLLLSNVLLCFMKGRSGLNLRLVRGVSFHSACR